VILPQVSFLEMEGTAISSDNRILEFHNPKKSFLWENLLATFAQADLLKKKEAKPEIWLNKAQEIISQTTDSEEAFTDEKLLDFLDTIENVNYKVPIFHSTQNKPFSMC